MELIINKTKWLGKESHYYEVIDSTNKKAKEIAEEGCSHGTLVVAEKQEAGVGRRGRSWSSESGHGIYMSFVLRPELGANKADRKSVV